jgi:hypothetical protein
MKSQFYQFSLYLPFLNLRFLFLYDFLYSFYFFVPLSFRDIFFTSRDRAHGTPSRWMTFCFRSIVYDLC